MRLSGSQSPGGATLFGITNEETVDRLVRNCFGVPKYKVIAAF